ncbi:MAG: glycogen-binding domain-containing protein, partial [bacterium]
MRAGLLILVAALMLGAAGAYGGAAKAPGGIEFTYYDPSAYSVSVAGSFNNWEGQANPMTKDAEGTWRGVVQLAPGKHEYKFVVNGGTWMADPDNPRVVGDYGNSELEIAESGEPVAGGAASAISNTIANARVMLNGWFRSSYATRRDARAVYGNGNAALGDARWRLSRPAHEMYVSVNPTLGSEVKGSLTLRLDSGVGDIRETRADLYAGRIDFRKSIFGVAAYFNEETLELDDPLQALGHRDLAGTAEDDDIAFGRGAQGMTGDISLAGARFEGSYSNIYDYDIYNSPLRWRLRSDTTVAPPFEISDYDTMPKYDNAGTDVIALRGKRAFGKVAAGVTYTSVRNGWWVPFESNSSQAVQDYKDATGNTSYWFELGTSDRLVAGDLAVSPAEG